jgi:molybdate transport system regulatory protein
MKAVEFFLPGDWQAGVRVWLERAGRAIMGKGRWELLSNIERCHSISAAARDMGMSYRHAWLMVQRMNEAVGEPLVLSATGGRDGGGARLTSLGRWAVRVFREVEDHLQQSAATLLGAAADPCRPDSVHVAAAVCLEEVLGQLLTDYGLLQPHVRIRTVFGASDELANHVLAGAPVDLFISAGPDALHRLEAAGIATDKTRAVLAANTLAAIGSVDHELPVRSSADLVRSGVKRIALAAPTCPLGRYTQAYLRGLGLYDRLVDRAVFVENSRAVGSAVRGRSADVGLVYGSDAFQAAGCRLLFKARKGPLPMQVTGAVLRSGHHPDQAAVLLSFLASRGAADRFRRCGFLETPKPPHTKGRRGTPTAPNH